MPCASCYRLRKGLENESVDLFKFVTIVFVLDNGGDNTAVIGIAVGVSVGLLCIAVVIIVIAILIYRGYKVKHRY